MRTSLRVEVSITSGTLTPGEWVEGTAVGYRRKSGKVAFQSTWAGEYVGTQEPDPTDPWMDPETGMPAEDQGDTVHLFQGGHVNGHPQRGTHGFPVEQVR